MTSDYDPRDLRAIAEDHQAWCHESHHDVPPWVDYILATVRDDDGEEQPTETVNGNGVMVRACRKPRCVWVSIDSGGDCVALSFPSLTRGQFRDLCRGLGVSVESATPGS